MIVVGAVGFNLMVMRHAIDAKVRWLPIWCLCFAMGHLLAKLYKDSEVV